MPKFLTFNKKKKGKGNSLHKNWWVKTLLLGYCFLDEAVRRYAGDVIAAEDKILEEGIGFIDGPAWLEVAKYLKKASDERYEK